MQIFGYMYIKEKLLKMEFNLAVHGSVIETEIWSVITISTDIGKITCLPQQGQKKSFNLIHLI